MISSIKKHPFVSIITAAGVILIVQVSIVAYLNSNGYGPKPLNASIARSAAGLAIHNNDTVGWSGCTVYLNHDYTATYNLSPGENVLPYSSFTQDDGTRFNYLTTSPTSATVMCSDPPSEYSGGW